MKSTIFSGALLFTFIASVTGLVYRGTILIGNNHAMFWFLILTFCLLSLPLLIRSTQLFWVSKQSLVSRILSVIKGSGTLALTYILSGLIIWSYIYYSDRHIRDADALVLIGEFEAAEGKMKQHVLNYPNDPFGRMKLVDKYLDKQKYSLAVEALESLEKEFDEEWYRYRREFQLSNDRAYRLLKEEYDACVGTCTAIEVKDIAFLLEATADMDPYLFESSRTPTNYFESRAKENFDESHAIGDLANWLEHRDNQTAIEAVWAIDFNLKPQDAFSSLIGEWAHSWFDQKNYHEAAEAFILLSETIDFMKEKGYEDGYALHGEVLYNIAVSESNQANHKEALVILKQLRVKFPNYNPKLVQDFEAKTLKRIPFAGN